MMFVLHLPEMRVVKAEECWLQMKHSQAVMKNTAELSCSQMWPKAGDKDFRESHTRGPLS